MKIYREGETEFQERSRQLRDRSDSLREEVEVSVREILGEVRARGDRALLDYTLRYDGVSLQANEIEVSREERAAAHREIEGEALSSLRAAVQRIRDFHQRQQLDSWMMPLKEGGWAGQLVRPLSRVGVYVPGGKAAYPSSVLMNAIPARVAGVEEIHLCTPTLSGKVDPAVLVAADLAGVDRIYRIGGAQAIGALAFGTETIPPVDKIVGPGNIYVTAAKRLVYGQVDLDLLAGPSEVVILAEESAPPAYIAADLLAQAEHDEQALAVLITPSEGLALEVQRELGRQLPELSRSAIIEQSLEARGAIFVTHDLESAARLADEIAPEHLEIMTGDPWELARRMKNAGAIFLGPHSPLALGDYLAGPNHVLPTGGTARFFSPLGVYSFVKRTNLLSCSAVGMQRIAPQGMRLAHLEGLDGHARSLGIRG